MSSHLPEISHSTSEASSMNEDSGIIKCVLKIVQFSMPFWP